MFMRTLALFLLAALLTGCASPTKYNFDVSLRNATSGPLTVDFVKKGPPNEPQWASPESYTALPPSRQPTEWGKVIAAGKTAEVHVTGEIYPGAPAYLRVYAGEHPLNELLAISRGTGGRLDLVLVPGRNNAFIITDPNGKLAAKLFRFEAVH